MVDMHPNCSPCFHSVICNAMTIEGAVMYSCMMSNTIDALDVAVLNCRPTVWLDHMYIIRYETCICYLARRLLCSVINLLIYH